MRPTRRHLRWLSGCLIGLLLFAQWATAGYVCPQPGAAGDGSVAVTAMADCSGDMGALDPAQPQLCKAHCESGRQSVNSGSQNPEVPAPIALAGALAAALDVAAGFGGGDSAPALTAAGPPRGSPPLYLCLLVLRN